MGRGEPPIRVLGEDRPVNTSAGRPGVAVRASALSAVVAAVLLLALSACGSGSKPSADASSSMPTASPTRATPAPRPPSTGCYSLTFDQALAPTTSATPVPCRRRHTTETYAVGRLSTVVGGHLLAVDSAHVRAQVAHTCPARLARYLGGSSDEVRLSMLRPVWFTPTVRQSDTGQSWFRCDVVAVAGPNRLLPITGRLKGVLAGSHAEDYAMCSTAKPGTAGFRRVPCQEKHSWRALRIVPIPGTTYPGVAKAKGAGQTICRNAGRSAASDALNFEWGYEWPTKQEWDGGQTYGVCWAPD